MSIFMPKHRRTLLNSGFWKWIEDWVLWIDKYRFNLPSWSKKENSYNISYMYAYVWFIDICLQKYFFNVTFQYIHKQIILCCLFICDVSIFTCSEHIGALKGMQIKRHLNRFYNQNTERELYLSVLPKPTIIDWGYNFCLLWQWTGEMVSNKTVAATAVTSEIASENNLWIEQFYTSTLEDECLPL